jgi:chromosome partitioning protein
VQQQINPDLRVEGVLITLANMRTNLARNSVEIIRGAYGGHVRIYAEPIPLSVKVKEASAVGKSIFVHESGGKAAMAYECLVREVIPADLVGLGQVHRARFHRKQTRVHG